MKPYELDERAQKIRNRFELPVILAGMFIIPVILIEERAASTGWITLSIVLNWVIWGTFLAEYITMLRHVDDKWAYTRSDWLDVTIIVLTFPVLPTLLATLRIMRVVRLAKVLRLLRLVKLAAVFTKAAMAMRRVFDRAALKFALGLSALLALGFGTVIAIEEPELATPLDGMWWAFVTLTTVGYGDIAPTSAVGRTLAIVLIVLGISVIAIITASVAAGFVEEDEAALYEEVALVHERLDRIEHLLVRAEAVMQLEQVAAAEPNSPSLRD